VINSAKYLSLVEKMVYAVVKTGGKQYRVSQGDLVQVEKVKGETGDKVELDKVLLIGGNDEAKIGTPTLPEAKVTAEIVEHKLAKKIIVFKKKRRKNYSRKQGHRQRQTTLKITEIQG
jgi:large subunit ribosomal protein L21